MSREHFTTSRELEYFSEKELNSQIGCTKNKWAETLLKELIDNSLDSCESIGVLPDVDIVIADGFISVQDNGPGIPEKVIANSLDYNVRVSDKNLYISPTRGQLGNALKCVYAVPFVLDGEQAHVEIHSNGVKHDITITIDRVAQKPIINRVISDSHFESYFDYFGLDTSFESYFGYNVQYGSFIKIYNLLDTSLENDENDKNDEKELFSTKCLNLVQLFAMCNCHASFTVNIFDEEHLLPRNTRTQIKWTTNDPLVSHWYNLNNFTKLLAGFLKDYKDMSVNAFVSKFNGLKTSAKQKLVCELAGVVSRDNISQFVRDNVFDNEKISKLLASMKAVSRPVKPIKLGTIDPLHVETWLQDNVNHKSSKGFTSTGLPYTFDVFFKTQLIDERFSIEFCLNYSVLINAQFEYTHRIMQDNYIDNGDPVKLFIHISCPEFAFLGKGKNSFSLDTDLMSDLKAKIEMVCKDWKKFKMKLRREEIADNRAYNKHILEAASRINKTKKLSVKKAAFQVMEECYNLVSDNGSLPAGARQMMYKARKMIIDLTDNPTPWTNDSLFTQGYLTEFQELYPELTQNWLIAYDDRGHMTEPSGRIIPLGTLKVRDYINTWHGIKVIGGGDITHPTISMPTAMMSGPDGQYGHVLYIEKEGFYPLFDTIKLRERYGLAIMSSKGYCGTSAKNFIEHVTKKDIPILTVHDFDRNGFNIAHTLWNDTKRYKFSKRPNIIHLGFRLEDIEGLTGEAVDYPKELKKDPRPSLMEWGATKEEANYLVHDRKPYSSQWHGRRVELNEMTSKQFVDWIEKRLKDVGVKKVVPDKDILDETYLEYYKATLKEEVLDTHVYELMEKIELEIDAIDIGEISIPEDIQDTIKEAIDNNSVTWTQAIKNLVIYKQNSISK